VFNAPGTREFARAAAQRTMVLLRNENHTLPLKKTVQSIAVIGPLADSAEDIQGSWTIEGSAKAVSALEGIRGKLRGVRVEWVKGASLWRLVPSMFPQGNQATTPPGEQQMRSDLDAAVAASRNADVIIAVLGEQGYMSGEAASRSTLSLPGNQQQLLEALVATGRPVVLVLLSGRPLDISWAAEHVPAILQAWYPGTEGGNALADVLFGDANPGGKLPVSWPRSVGQEPLYYNHNLTHEPESRPNFRSRYWDALSTPLFPFGYGLSYTTFSISNLRLNAPTVRVGATLEVTADVRNTGSVAGDEVVQLYIHQQAGSASRPVRQLEGFQRVSLAPGETKTVRFNLGKDELSFWSPQKEQWVEEPEQFDVWVGQDSRATLHGTFKVTE
jgi:beta-glucosidase